MHITDMSKGIMGMNGIVGASYYMAAGAALRAHGARHQAGGGRVLRRRRGGVAVLLQRGAQLREPEAAGASSSTRTTSSTWACRWRSTVPTKYISEYTKGLDIPHHLVDGNDVSAVYAATQRSRRVGARRQGPEHDRGR